LIPLPSPWTIFVLKGEPWLARVSSLSRTAVVQGLALLHGIGKFVCAGDQLGRLPKLCVGQNALEARHPCQPDSIGSFPIALLRRVVAHTLPLNIKVALGYMLSAIAGGG